MTISNGSTITSTDLNAMCTTQMGLLETDNLQLPLGFHHAAVFANLVAGTGATRRKHTFVMPVDCYLEALCLTAADHTAASTTTATVTADGALTSWPTARSGTTGAGFTAVARLLYDNTKTKVNAAFSTTSQAFRVFPKGTTVTVVVETTSVATPSQTVVVFAFRQFFARE